MGFPIYSDVRIVAVAKHVLKKSAAKWHVFVYDRDIQNVKGLLSQVIDLVDVNKKRIITVIDKGKGGIYRTLQYVYLRDRYCTNS